MLSGYWFVKGLQPIWLGLTNNADDFKDIVMSFKEEKNHLKHGTLYIEMATPDLIKIWEEDINRKPGAPDGTV